MNWTEYNKYRNSTEGQVNALVCTSVDDLRSTLKSPSSESTPTEVLQLAFERATSKGLKTKAKLLQSVLKHRAKHGQQCCFGIGGRLGERCTNRATWAVTFEGRDCGIVMCDEHSKPERQRPEKHGIRKLITP